jgi:hypothetical protein
VSSPDVDGVSTSCTPSLPPAQTRPQGGQHDDVGFVGWPLRTRPPAGVPVCSLGQDETLGREAIHVKSRRRDRPSGRPLVPAAGRISPGLGVSVTVVSRVLIGLLGRVFSRLAAWLEGPLKRRWRHSPPWRGRRLSWLRPPRRKSVVIASPTTIASGAAAADPPTSARTGPRPPGAGVVCRGCVRDYTRVSSLRPPRQSAAGRPPLARAPARSPGGAHGPESSPGTFGAGPCHRPASPSHRASLAREAGRRHGRPG